MRLALTQDKQMVEAGPGAPERAECPHCGNIVDLRYRKDSNTWFWRHRRKPPGGCPPEEAEADTEVAPVSEETPTLFPTPGWVLGANLDELVEIAQECGAEVRTLAPDESFEYDGPATVIVARRYDK